MLILSAPGWKREKEGTTFSQLPNADSGPLTHCVKKSSEVYALQHYP